MNYRHAFHAGNFADVFKHAVLARIITYLSKKDSAFRVIDTHAGTGLYDLGASQAERTGEWRDGIARIWQRQTSAELTAFLMPYLEVVESLNPDGNLRTYPGSPVVAQTMAREQDRIALCELHPEDNKLLREAIGRDPRVSIVELDGWTALNAQVPPRERRGVVLIDPPFEQHGELKRLTDNLARAHAKWPTGIFMLWYPIKNVADIEHFSLSLKKLELPGTLRCELYIRAADDPSKLSGNGLIIVNPPWTLKAELDAALPALTACLAQGDGAAGRSQWIVPQP